MLRISTRKTAGLVGALVLAWSGLAATAAQAAGTGAAGKNGCAHIVSTADATRGLGTATPQTSEVSAASVAVAKQQWDTPQARLAMAAAADPAAAAEKASRIAAGTVGGPSAVACADKAGSNGGASVTPYLTTGSGYAYIGWLYQYGEVRNSFCGPAAVEVASATTPGSSPVGLSQYTIAGYLASDVGGNWTTIDNRGTNVNEEVNGLNHFVGVPDYGWNYFTWAGMDYTPTSAQRSTFLSDLKYDVSKNTPVTGDAYEVAGGPHLVGHPVSETIFHYFSIGGWNDNTGQVWYSDPATTVWSSVPAYSWFNSNTLETILGGRGYAW